MTISSVLSDVEAWVGTEIKSGETAAINWWHSFEPILEADFKKFVDAVKPIALALITSLAQAALSGPAKLQAVSSALIAAAGAQGIQATMTMANTLVQQIVASLGAAVPAAATAR